MKEWFLLHWKKLIPVATLLLGWFVGIKLTVKPGAPDSKPEIVIIIPAEDPTDPFFQAQARGGFHPFFYNLARVHAAQAYRKEKGGSFAAAWAKMRRIKNSDIDGAAIQAEIPVGELGDGSILKKIVDWFTDPANQAKLKALIQFLLEMALLFGDAQASGPWASSLFAWSA